MSKESEIKAAIRRMANANGPAVWVGKVCSVEDEECSVEVDGLELEGVRLKAVTGGNAEGLLIVPSVGSYVVVADVGEKNMSQMVVVGWSDVDKIEFRGGEKGGLVNVESLVERMNALEDDLNKLKQVFAGWTPVPQDGGSVLKTAAASWSSGALQKTKRADIEDELITH